MNGAEEVLSDKYALIMMQAFPSLWKDYGSIRFASWAQQPDIALRALGSPELESCPASVKELLIIDGAKTLEAGKLFSEARLVLERTPLASASAEHRFYYAEALLNTGAPEQARQVLEELVLRFTGEVFSEKARIVLLGLRNKI
jgi:thioredoxin-like negative regulator of GroEL